MESPPRRGPPPPSEPPPRYISLSGRVPPPKGAPPPEGARRARLPRQRPSNPTPVIGPKASVGEKRSGGARQRDDEQEANRYVSRRSTRMIRTGAVRVLCMVPHIRHPRGYYVSSIFTRYHPRLNSADQCYMSPGIVTCSIIRLAQQCYKYDKTFVANSNPRPCSLPFRTTHY